MSEETFRWIIAAGVAIATLCIVGMSIMMLSVIKVVAQLKGKVDHLVDRTEPMIDSVRFVINENGPKLNEIMTSAKETAANVRDVSVVAKDQAQRFGDVGRDIADRTKVQVARVDAAVDDTVEHVQELGANLKSAAMKPAAEFSGVIAGIRAGVSAYANGMRPNVSRATQDEEMFI
jgi:methyl-accepting chemotaxis protein